MHMRTNGLIMLAAGAALVLSACAGGGTSAAKPAGGGAATAAPAKAAAKAGNAAQGQTLFAQSCSSCHGPDAKGLPGLGKDLTTSAFVKGQTDPQLVDFIKKGRPASDPANTTHVDMPPKGGNPALTDAQMGDIAAYIRTINK